MDWQDRIVADPKVFVGKPVVKGNRLAAEFILELLAEGGTHGHRAKPRPVREASESEDGTLKSEALLRALR